MSDLDDFDRIEPDDGERERITVQVGTEFETWVAAGQTAMGVGLMPVTSPPVGRVVYTFAPSPTWDLPHWHHYVPLKKCA